jgi:hypothetical protein
MTFHRVSVCGMHKVHRYLTIATICNSLLAEVNRRVRIACESSFSWINFLLPESFNESPAS